MSSAVVGAGFVLSGRYRLVEPLASGGMGTVWRAVDLLLDRPVAVKEVRLPPGLDDDARQQLRRRTIREAQVAARLRHPAIVTIYDVVEQGGRPWIVMELVPSRSLADIIYTDGPLPPVPVAAIGLRVLDAIVAAAAAGVEHRDIKPANVLVTNEGRVVLTDFGIARHVGDESLTSAGLIVGSPDYLAPERARGRAGGLAADLWSLGATMYDAVEGRRPFERDGALPTLAAVVMDEPDPPERAGPLQPVIDGLLVKDPAHRLDADRTRLMLARILRGRPAAATMPLPRQPLDDGIANLPTRPTAGPDEGAATRAIPPADAVDAAAGTTAAGTTAAGTTAAGTAGTAGAAAPAGTPGTRDTAASAETARTAGAAASAGAAGTAGTAETAETAETSGAAETSGTARAAGAAGAVLAGTRGTAQTTGRNGGAGIADAPAIERPGPPTPRPDGRRRRSAVLAGLVLLVLAGVAAILVPVLSDGAPNQATGPTTSGAATAPTGGPGTASSGTASAGTASAGTAPSTARPTTATRTTAASPTPAGPATGSRVKPPPGFTRYTDPRDGFSLVIPSGWRPVRLGSRVDLEDPTSSRFLRIDTTDTPLPDPYQNWIDYERQFRQDKTDYHLLGIRRVTDYRPEEGWTVADWEFTLGSTHVLDRNIRVSDARAHAIYWSTPESRWDDADSREILRLAEQSFVPAPAGR
jgi:eukaryotic-like serine/threonine-protein kinase